MEIEEIISQWVDCVGFESLYKISPTGIVFSFRTNKLLRLNRHHQGYMEAKLYKDQVGKHYRVHRLVALAYIPNPNTYPMVNHKNGIKDDNRVENLEWCDRSHNEKHAFKMGLKDLKGEKHNTAKLNNSNVQAIKILLEEGVSQQVIAKAFEVKPPTISNIATGKRWAHLETSPAPQVFTREQVEVMLKDTIRHFNSVAGLPPENQYYVDKWIEATLNDVQFKL